MPKLVDHVQYRKQLLGQCFDLFSTRGYSALTTRQIAEALNVSSGTLYHYFPTKEALFQQLVEEVSQQTVFEALAQMPEHASFEERLLEFFRFLEKHEEHFQKQQVTLVDYYQHRELYGSNAQEIIQAAFNRYDQAIQTYVGVSDPDLRANLHAYLNGILNMRMMLGARVPLLEQAGPFIKMFTRIVRGAEKADA